MAEDKDNRNDDKALPLENSRSQVWAFFEKHPMDPGCAEHLKYWFSLSAPPIPAGADRPSVIEPTSTPSEPRPRGAHPVARPNANAERSRSRFGCV